ncbi:hypothetical protein K493DRAFT_318750 [Basidiobolus meristosporus CBS 931.73]|uniref:G-protein coupled receptors family 1 profile domain-containing protein n=1 Tax=Basidiobolus meristosporus CBS 931.73 TaxID=1314790 RepID=A0A1Y1XUC4_9FUNG|nr:hypothetical protein K493DRAFT_318750 [Basidiobolus meristosporus CBS 931.73]|eukprot:ORX89362.1 hypothetical protein K493DRAFT_318750 [Basidiobolus meristosporus CBS 931.73]
MKYSRLGLFCFLACLFPIFLTVQAVGETAAAPESASAEIAQRNHSPHALGVEGPGAPGEQNPSPTGESGAAGAGEAEDENHYFSDFAPHGSIFFYMLTTITATLNICCSSAVIYTSYMDYQEIKYKNAHLRKKPHLSSSIRFPFYIAMLDLFLGIVTLFMVSDTMYFDELPSKRVCAVIGGIIYLGIIIEMTVVGTVAVVTYFQLALKINVYLGRWDWKVWVGCILSCLAIAVSGIITKGFGPDLYWCLVNEHTDSGKVFLKLFLGIHYAVLFIVLVCYLGVLYNMVYRPHAHHSSTRSEESGSIKRTITTTGVHRSNSMQEAVQHHQKHTEHLGMALFLHVFHFTPAIVHMILQLKNYHRAWVYVLAASFIQLGGVLNGFEVFMHRKKPHPRYRYRSPVEEHPVEELPSPQDAS